MIANTTDSISKTRSLCPVCHEPIEAMYREEGDRVYFIQNCPEHGTFSALASENAEDFKSWIDNPVINIPPKQALTKGDPDDMSCPLHCGPCENHLQTACCVLIDVTERCNQHCPYCFAVAGEDDASDEPTLEEIEKKLDFLLTQGEDGREFNIQISGGEPTVRDDLPEIIAMARDKGFRYIQINSNGRRIAEEEGYAEKLQQAGASVIFMQFDGTRDDIYERLRGEPLLEKKIQAIRNCEAAGLAVTLVPTVVKGVNDDNIGEMMDFLLDNVNVVKGVHFQPASFFGRHPGNDERITMFGLLRKLEAQRPQFKYTDSMPISTGHPLCCFYSTYIKEPDGIIRCTLGKSTPDDSSEGECCCCCGDGEFQETGAPSCCDMTKADQLEVLTPGCCDMTKADQLEVIKKDRDYVLNKWDVSVPQECCCGCEPEEPTYKSSEEITDLDEFLTYYRRNTFTVTGMAFQDESNLDAERLKRCRVVQLTDDNRLIPFCAYNTIYREQFKKER